MTAPTVIYLDADTIVERVACPDCGAHAGTACWSRFLERRMTNEVHRDRRSAAVGVQPERGRHGG